MQPFQQKVSDYVQYGTQNHIVTGATADCISKIRFSPKECPATLLGATAWDGSCSVWQVGVDSLGNVGSIPSWTTVHDGPLLDMVFSNDSRVFFAGCTQTAVMWDVQADRKSVVATHDLPISCMSFISASQIGSDVLITGGWDGKLRWWDLRAPNFVKEDNLNEPIFALDAQKTFPMMAAATGRKLHIYDQTMNKFKELKPPDTVKFNLRAICCSPTLDGISMGSSEGRFSYIPISGEQGKACTFKAHMSSQVCGSSSIYLAHQVNFVAHHPLFPVVFTGGGDGCIAAINRDKKTILKSGAIECSVKHENQSVSVSAGDLSADGSLLAYAHSYDWALGKKGYRKQPSSIHIKTIQLTPSRS